MRTRTTIIVVALAAVAAFAGGCGSDKTKCPTESPAIEKIANCTRAPGVVVNYPIQLCPTCNQIVSSCDVDMVDVANGRIFLNPVVEVCESASSCGGASCNLNPTTCSFTVPNAANGTTFTVFAFDPRTNQEVDGTLTVQSGQAPFCSTL